MLYCCLGNTITVGGCLRWNVVRRTPGRRSVYGKYTKEKGFYVDDRKLDRDSQSKRNNVWTWLYNRL